MSLFTPFNVGQPAREEQTGVGTQQQFHTSWDVDTTRDRINHYNSNQAVYTE